MNKIEYEGLERKNGVGKKAKILDGNEKKDYKGVTKKTPTEVERKEKI